MNRHSNPERFSLNGGFTLIELLVVIAIIALLAAIVLSNVQSAVAKAQYARAAAEIKQITNAITYAEQNTGETLEEITTSAESDWSCRPENRVNPDLRGISTSDTCYSKWIQALQNIQAATGGVYTHLANFARDPWGSPYNLDENEGEAVSGNPAAPCRKDLVLSAGPNGIREESATGTDDYYVYMPFSGNKFPVYNGKTSCP